MAGVMDARLNTGFALHPKTQRLERRLGGAGAWSLVRLILWAAANKPDGDLSGLSDEDLEIVAGWQGEFGKFVATLADVRFLDGEPGGYKLHDWNVHQPWAAGAEARSEKSRWAALCKKHGREEATRQMPEYAQRLQRAPETGANGSQDGAAGSAQPPDSGASGTPLALPESASGTPKPQSGSAPSPIPTPIPSPTPTLEIPPLPPKGGKRTRRTPADMTEDFLLFELRFWSAYPRKTQKQDAYAKWRALKVSPELLPKILDGLEKWKRHDRWIRDGGKFRHHPATWLHQRLWEDEEVCGTGAKAEQSGPPPWVTSAGFDSVEHASNHRCYAHNAHHFRDGARIEPAEAAP